jgi:hypothetical protein
MTVAQLIAALSEARDPNSTVYVGGCGVEQLSIARVIEPTDEKKLEEENVYRECVVIVWDAA